MNSEVEQQGDEKELKRYIEGWLQCKKDKKFKRMWCVLKGQILGANNVVAAYLFCFKDSNTHVREHFVGSYNIDVLKENVTLVSVKGDKHMKCEFDISLGESKLQFMADDNITRERWIYALVDLVGNRQPPSELPDLQNNIRSFKLASFSPRKSSRSFIGSIGKSKTLGSEPSKQWSSSLSVSVDIPDSGPILNKSCDSFLLGKEKTLSGLRPRTFQPEGLLSTEWYHGPVTRDEAVKILYREPVGTYFLRDCSSEAGSFTLTFKDSDKIKHHKIQAVGQSKYQFEDSEIKTLFVSPQDAVRFYMQTKNKAYFSPRPLTERGVGDGAEDKRRLEENTRPPSFRSSMFKSSNQYEYTPERRSTSASDFMKSKSHSVGVSGISPTRPAADQPFPVSRTNSMPPRPREQPRLRPTLSKQKTLGDKLGRSSFDGEYVEDSTNYTMGRVDPGQKPYMNQDNEYLTGAEVAALRQNNEDDERYLTDDQLETPFLDKSEYPTLVNNGQPSPTHCDQRDARKHSYVNEPLPEIPDDNMYIQPKNDDEEGGEEEDSLYINQEAIEMAQRSKADIGPPPPIPPRTYNPQRLASDTYVNIPN